jgi:hypothetical protein
MLVQQMPLITGVEGQLETGGVERRPEPCGEAVFEEQPPSAPDAPP